MDLRLRGGLITTIPLLTCLSIYLTNAVNKVPGTCTMRHLGCSENQCELVTTAITHRKVIAVNWFLNNREINTRDNRNNRYTGSFAESPYPLTRDVVCFQTILALTVQPFLSVDYGVYKCLLTTENGSMIQCEFKASLGLQESSIDGNSAQNTVTIKANYIYIAVGVVAGCVTIITILFIVVILLARRRSRNRSGASNENPSRSDDRRNTRKISNGQSNHTYASISSEIPRYECLSGRRDTKDGYDVPLEGAREGERDRLAVPDQSDDYRLSDTSFDLDSAFSSSSYSIAKEVTVNEASDQVNNKEMHDPHYSSRPRVSRSNKSSSGGTSKTQLIGNPSYSGGNFREQDQLIVVNKTVNKTSVIEIRRKPSTSGNDTNQDTTDYQNLKRTRRLT